MEKNSNSSYRSSSQRKGNATSVVVFLIILALLLGIGGAFLLRETLETKYQVQVAQMEARQANQQKQELLEQLNEIEGRYNQLMIEYEDLQGLFRAEKNRVSRLRKQLQESGLSEGGPSGAEVANFREQISQLEEQLQSYQTQIEMMAAENQELAGENSQMQTTLTETAQRNEILEDRNDELETKLEQATILTISELEGVALRERRRGDEPTEKARKADKLRICFTVNQNLVAEPGNRDFYIRLTDPNNQVLTYSPDETIDFEGETIQYTVQRTVNYQNAAQEVCVVWEQEEKFDKGYYNVVVFTEGEEVGYKLFQLN